MQSERLSIPFDGGGVDSLSAIWERPTAGTEARESAILFAHGAGAPMEADFMSAVARGLVARGFPVLRFQYPYFERALAEGRRRPPDRQPVLEAAHVAACGELVRRAGSARILLAGKSLGARISSILAAKDLPSAGLVFFGYPLHPAGKPEKLRKEHFSAVVQPELFLQGDRDALCDLGLLREALRTFGGNATLAVIADGDHGFHVRKKSGRSDEEALEECLERVADWESETFG